MRLTITVAISTNREKPNAEVVSLTECKSRHEQSPVELPDELLISFAKYLAPEAMKFYRSDKGKSYYEKWLLGHPEYAEK